MTDEAVSGSYSRPPFAGYGETPSPPPYPEYDNDQDIFEEDDGTHQSYFPMNTKESDYFRHQEELYTIESVGDMLAFLRIAPFSPMCKISLSNIITTHYGKTVVLTNLQDILDATIKFAKLLNLNRMNYDRVDIRQPLLSNFENIMINMFYWYSLRAVHGSERIFQAKYTLAQEQKITNVIERDQSKKRGWAFWKR